MAANPQGNSTGNAGVQPVTAYRRGSRPSLPHAGAGSKRAPLARLSVAGEGRGGEGARRGGRYLDSTYREHLPSSLKRNILAGIDRCLRACGRDREADKITSCGSFWHVFGSPCGSHHLTRATCDHPLCTKCARGRSLPLQRKVLGLTRQKPKVFRFLTVTARNVSLITRTYVAWLIQSFGELRATKLWMKRVLGGVYSIETTYNLSDATWHVHLHVIIECEHSLPPTWIFRLRSEWSRITGGSHVINLRAVNRRAVRELVKYQVKAVSLVHSPELIDQYLRAFHHVRRLQCFGSFLGAEIPPVERKTWRCACGLCQSGSWLHLFQVHDSDTVESADGGRQLKFGFSGPSPPSEKLTVEKLLLEYPDTKQERGWYVCF